MLGWFKRLFEKRNVVEPELVQFGFMLEDFFDRAGCEQVLKWSAERHREKTSYWYGLKIHLIDWMMIKAFFDGITLVVALGVLLTCVFTFLCMRYNVEVDFQTALIVSCLIFPLSMLIRSDFLRKDTALLLLADLRSSIFLIFLLCRGYKRKLGLPSSVMNALLNTLLQIIVHLREYLQTRSPDKIIVLRKIAYEDLSDLTRLLNLYFDEHILGIPIFISRLQSYYTNLVTAFEKLKAIREYRSSRAIRSFSKLMMLLTPVLFCPFYVHMGKKVNSSEKWSPYIFGALTAFVFGSLQSIQDRLDDPFLGVTYDEINLDDLYAWAKESLGLNANRTEIIGRFIVRQSDRSGEPPNTRSEVNIVKLPKKHPVTLHHPEVERMKTI